MPDPIPIPDPTAWLAGPIDWSQPAGPTNVVQLRIPGPEQGDYELWWRPERPAESFDQSVLQFASAFDWAAYGTVVLDGVAQEWSPDGRALLQERRFGATPEDATVFF